MRRSWLIGAVAAASVLCWPAGALASVTPGWECVPTTVGQPVLSGGTGSSPSCSSGTPVLAPTYTGSGVGGQPTVVFSGLNVQIVDGLAATSAVNGTGNLVLGYDENPSGRKQTGSHDLIVGEDNGYTSYGQLVAGYDDQVTDSYATAIGLGNLASGYASLAAGHGNTASGSESTVAGGQSNHASGPESSIAGGAFNTAGGTYGVVAGGCSNLAGSGTVTVNADCKSTKTFAGDFASVTGGAGNQATAIDSAVSGAPSTPPPPASARSPAGAPTSTAVGASTSTSTATTRASGSISRLSLAVTATRPTGSMERSQGVRRTPPRAPSPPSAAAPTTSPVLA